MRRVSSVAAMPFSVTISGSSPAGDLPRPSQRGLERLRPELVAHGRHQLDALLRADRTVGPDAGPGVGLHAEEVVASGDGQELVLHAVADAVAHGLAAVDRDVVGHGHGQPDRHARRAGPDGVDGLAVRGARAPRWPCGAERRRARRAGRSPER